MKQNRFTYAAAVGAAVPNALRRKSDRKSERKLVEGVAESEGVPACNVEGCPHPDDSLDRTRLALATCDMCSDSFHVGCASRQLTPSGEKRFPGECGRCGILARLFCLFCGMGSENHFPVLVTCATCKRGFHKNCRKSGDSHSSTCGRHLCVGQPPVKWACTASPNPDDGQAAADTGAAAARAEKAEGMAAQQQAAGNMEEAQLEEAPPTFAAVVRAEPGDGLVEKHKLSLIPKKEAGDADAADPGPEVENEAVEGGSDRKRRSPCPVHGPRAAQSEPDELSDTDTEQAEASIPRGPLSARAPRALEELDTQVGTPSGPFEHSPGGVLDPLNLFNDSVGRNTPIDSRMHHHSADAAELFNRERAATGSLTTDLARPRSEGWEGRREVTPSSAEPPVLASKARQAEIAELEARVRIQALKMQLAQGAAALAQAGIASAASPGPEVGATAAATAAAPQAAATAAASPAAATAAAPPAAATAAAPPAAATAAAPPAAATAAAPPAAATAAAPPAAATTDAPPAAATATAPSAAAPSRPVLFHAPSSPGETAPPEMPYEWVYGGVYYNSDSVPPQHHGRALAALPQYPPMMLGLDPYPAQTPYAQTYRAPHGRAAHDAMLPGYALAVQQQYPEQLVTMPLRQAMRLNAALSRQLPPEWSSQPRQSWDPFYGPGMRRP
ncbi:hypothetical protein CYMTET_17271 [Cymbomonas tetramitiformis]|uniref:Zinc finger PHD-type domain-containing protein n=1 Tax=Cymbomonas tetramitiformis TaxID=36881 RepID=A0AAE0GAZ0_9CHLO|nr:hypothetical protein CYMTET_17271 [Cymbomonas tetramitiformis]